jgi:outer membrane immunogenic protein
MIKTLGAAALLTTALVSPALAAGGWNGLYVGAVGTLGMMNSDNSDHWCNVACNGPSQSSFGGGIGGTLGANWQDGSFVWGLEGDMSWVDFENKLIVNCSDSECASVQSAAWNWYSTIRARAGIDVDNTLFYATGGLAIVGVHYRSNYYTLPSHAWDGGFAPENKALLGLTVGAGVERDCGDGWSFKGEFLYIQLPDSGGPYYDGLPSGSPDKDGDSVLFRSSAMVARVGLNYALDE